MGFEPAACWEAGTLTTSTMQLGATKVRAASAEEISSFSDCYRPSTVARRKQLLQVIERIGVPDGI